MKTPQEISAALRAAKVVISYVPLADEPDAETVLKKHGFSGHVMHAPKDPDFSPQEFANAVRHLHEGKNVCVLVPGRRFDAHGTRHGRGDGWYDRFLAVLPKEWKKIGVALPHHVSDEPLERKAHDYPMDAVLVCEE